MAPATGNDARIERKSLPDYFGYPPVCCNTAKIVALPRNVIHASAESIDRSSQQLANEARQFLDGA